jgi:hypothetical protein
MLFTTMNGSFLGVEKKIKKKKKQKFHGCYGKVVWLLVQGQLMPWLL